MCSPNRGMRPRPVRLNAVSTPTASPSQNHGGTSNPAMDWPCSPKKSQARRTRPRRMRSNCTTWRISWTASSWYQSPLRSPAFWGGVLNQTLRRGARATKPLA